MLANFDVKVFEHLQIAVVGDCMLDTWMSGEVHRISPEAPVPVVQLQHTQHMLGGATNVARNLAHLGAQVHLFGVTGTDAAGEQLQQLCDAEPGIQAHFVRSTQRVTTQKTRICAHNHQIVRLDQEVTQDLNSTEQAQLESEMHMHLGKCAAIILSDYKKGTCTWSIIQHVRQHAQHNHTPWLVDPKHTDWSRYSGCDVITPNLKEYLAASGQHSLQEASARRLCAQYGIRNLLVTQAERGMSLINPSDHAHVNSKLRSVADVSGAGDTVIATLTLGMCSGLSMVQSMVLANLAAGISVSKPGTATVTPPELSQVLLTV